MSCMPRLDMPPDSRLTSDQLRVCAEAMSGKRGKIPAPMIAWIRSPELAARAQRLGEAVRFDTTIEPPLSEMAILVCARHWVSHVEWNAHKAIALRAGLAPGIVADIAARRPPRFADERARAVYEVSRAMLEHRRMTDTLHRHAIDQLGEQGLVELIMLLGYYCLVSLTLNAFEIGLPQGVAAELEDPDFARSHQSGPSKET